jgi:hypothetical protein
MYTYWDEELGSYLLTEEGKKLTERGMINVIGNIEHSEDREDISKVFLLGVLFGTVATSDETLEMIKEELDIVSPSSLIKEEKNND